LIVNRFDDEQLDIHDVQAFLRHLLARVDWRRDLHFHTKTTIDTLDYSGDSLNMGSKVVIAAAGNPIRELGLEIPPNLTLSDGFKNPRLVLPGVVALEGPRPAHAEPSIQYLVPGQAGDRYSSRPSALQSALETQPSESPDISRFCAGFPSN